MIQPAEGFAMEPRGKKVTLYDVARDCVSAAKGNIDKACALFIRKLKADPDLMDAMMWPLIEMAVRHVVKSVTPSPSSMIDRTVGVREITAGGLIGAVSRKTSPKQPPQKQPRWDAMAQKKHALAIMEDWYSVRVHGALRLADATASDLRAAANKSLRVANGHQRTAKLFAAIADRLKKDQKVSEALTPEQINEISRQLA